MDLAATGGQENLLTDTQLLILTVAIIWPLSLVIYCLNRIRHEIQRLQKKPE
jgi:hypothetical protein